MFSNASLHFPSHRLLHMPVDHNTSEQKWKPHTEHAPYKPCQPKVVVDKKAPKTSVRPIQSHKRNNLTLHDWMTVFAYIDAHPGMSQDAIVEHFKTRAEGTLTFDQSMLSQKIKGRKELEAQASDHPNALSSKRVRVVTHPDVERVLFLWVKHMEEKGETVNGPMLVAKHASLKSNSMSQMMKD